MSENADPPKSRREVHWAVRMNYRNRVVCSLMIFVLVGAHLLDLAAGPLHWGVAALHFLVYPHLLYRLTLTAPSAVDVEHRNMAADAALLGLWVGVLHVPLWPSVALGVCALLHPSLFRGPRGLVECASLAIAGVAVGWGLSGGGALQLATSTEVTVLSVVLLGVYLLVFSLTAFNRAEAATELRRQFRSSELMLQQRLEEIEGLQSKLREQALRDPLTGLYNRRYLDETLGRELARAARDKTPLSVIFVDIDHFKAINDAHGHPAGDAVIQHLANLLQRMARESDLLCRYGGEEFLLVLPQATGAVAQQRAEALRQAFGADPTLVGDLSISHTLSLGVAEFPHQGHTPETLLSQADVALYRAKSQGRNRVVCMDAALPDAPAPATAGTI